MAVEDENLHQLVKDQKTEIRNMKDIVLQLQKELADSRATPPQLAPSPPRDSYNSPSNTNLNGFPGYTGYDNSRRASLYVQATDG